MRTTGLRLQHRTASVCSLILSVILLAGLAGDVVSAEENSAKTLKLAKMEGTVQVTDSIGKKLPSFEQMNLKNGQHVKTDIASFAWINMDDSKTAKLGQQSDVDISQQNEDLEIRLHSGDVLINVTKKVAKNATVKVRSGNSVTGITGSLIWAELIDENHARYGWLEHGGKTTVKNTITGEQMTIDANAGEVIDVTTGQSAGNASTLQVSKHDATAGDIPVSVALEARDDENFAGRVMAANPNLPLQDVAQNADAMQAAEEGRLQSQQNSLNQSLKSDNNAVNATVQQTKDDDKKAAEEANKDHSDHDDDDDDSSGGSSDGGSSQSGHTHIWPSPAEEYHAEGLHFMVAINSAVGNTWTATPSSQTVTITCESCEEEIVHTITVSPSGGSLTQDGLPDSTTYTWTCQTCGATGEGEFSLG